MVGRAFETRATQVVDDVRLDPDYVESCKEARSEIAVPLLWRQGFLPGCWTRRAPGSMPTVPRTCGSWSFWRASWPTASPTSPCGSALGRALGAAQLREAALQKLSRQQRGLVDLLVKMGGHVSLDALFRDVVEDLHGVLGYEHVYLACRSRRDRRCAFSASRDLLPRRSR